MKLHYLQHVRFEDPAGIADSAAEHDHRMTGTHLYRGDALPVLDAFDGLIVMGGPMGVGDTDQYPWLTDEISLVRAAIEAGKPTLGVCLGAQIIAAALGARVDRNDEKEIGFFDVTVTDAGRATPWLAGIDTFPAFHWHGETFDLPADAMHLASTPACANQAFSVGDHVLALQFHVESTPDSVQRLIAHCPEDITDGRYVQSAEQMTQQTDCYPPMKQILERLLGQLFA
jgi:GMP synthase-like glutamine amidotransferase